MKTEELKVLKQLVSKNYHNEEKKCQDRLGVNYIPIEKDGKWENMKAKIVEDSLMGNNVLIIGSEAILDKTKHPETNGDSDQLIFLCLKAKFKKYANAETFEEILEWPTIFTDISKVLEEKKPTWKDNALNMLDPSLRLLLESKCFRLVITTSFCPILEYALQKIWNNELDVKNILDDMNNQRDICRKENRKSEFYDIAPTLFYAFGKAKESVPSKYALTDDRKVFTIANWLGANKPKELLKYIERKDLLAIGCNFENWVFRFFWYIMGQKPDMPCSDMNEKGGSVAIMLTTEKNDTEKTIVFFEEKNIVYFNNSRIFMSLLAPELITENVPQEGEIFISYASEDFPTALKIYKYLKEQRQSVWFDLRLKAGDRYGDYIKNGIQQCNIFMPILSNQTKKDLEDIIHKVRTEKRYYMKEWDMAQEKAENVQRTNKELFIVIPIIIEEYSPTDSTYHNENMLPDCIYASSVYYSSKENITLDNLLKTINIHKQDWNQQI